MIAKLKHWRGAQSKNGWKGAPVPGFILFMLGIALTFLTVNVLAAAKTRIRVMVEVTIIPNELEYTPAI